MAPERRSVEDKKEDEPTLPHQERTFSPASAEGVQS